jgi:hypothetical protein
LSIGEKKFDIYPFITHTCHGNKYEKAKEDFMPMVFFTVTLSIITGMQLFDEPFILTGQFAFMGGMKNSTLAYINWIITNRLEGNQKDERLKKKAAARCDAGCG